MSQMLTMPPVTKTIGDLEFTTVPFPAWHALGLMPQLPKLGAALGVVAAGQAPGPATSPAEFQKTVLALLCQTYVRLDDGRKVELTTQDKFNQVFNGRFQTLFPVIEFVSEVNFGTFGDGSKSEPVAMPLPGA